MDKKYCNNQKGVVAILTLLAVSVFALAIMTTMSVLAASELNMSSSESASEKTFYAAEAGINEGLYRLSENASAQTFCMDFNGTNVPCSATEKIQVTVSNYPFGPGSLPDDRYKRIIESIATDSSGKVRKLEITAKTSSFGSGFSYAVLAGTGGFTFGNNSKIYGDTYSNGNLDGGSGNSPKGEVHGDLWVAGSTCTDPCVQTVHVFGKAHARSFRKSKIDSDIYYGAPAGIDSYTLSNSGTPHSNETDPLNKDFPVTIDQIKEMATRITSTHNEITTCNASGNYEITDTNPLPSVPTKILCNLVINTNNPVTLTANLWVTGDLTFPHPNQILWLPTTANGQSVSIILGDPFNPSDKGKVTINNNVLIFGSDHRNPPPLGIEPIDFVFFFSMSNSVAIPAISGQNNSLAAVYYAPLGLINVINNGKLNNATAYKVNLEENAEVRFVSTLSQFSITPTVQIDLAATNWREKNN